MKGYIGSREKCFICNGRLVHDEKRKGCFCLKHERVAATSFYVKFGKSIYRRFKDYEKASRFLTGLRFKTDEGSFDERDYKMTNPLGFETLSDKWLEFKEGFADIKPKTIQSYYAFIGRAVKAWGNRNIKEISDGDIADLLFDKNWLHNGKPVSNKTRNNMKSCLHDFWTWAVRMEKRNGKSLIHMPEFPEINYTLGWRNITTIENQEKILDEVKGISWHINPKIWLGIKLLSVYIKVRPGELRNVKEQDINLESGFIIIKYPKEGTRDEGKYIYLDSEDIELIRSMPKGFPNMYFFRHLPGRKGVRDGSQFGPKYFNVWWQKACKNLGIEGVSLYPGTKHTTATALGKILSPEEIRRGGTGSRTNKAFDRYFQPQQNEHVKVVDAVKKLKQQARGEIIDFKKKRNRE